MRSIKLTLIMLTVTCSRVVLADTALATDVRAEAVGGFFSLLPLYLISIGGFVYAMRRTGALPSREGLLAIAHMKRKGGEDPRLWRPSWGRKVAWPVVSGTAAAVTYFVTGEATLTVIAAGLVCLVTATYLATYSVLCGVGHVVRNLANGLSAAETDRREIAGIWVITVAMLALGVYAPATQIAALTVSPIVMLTCWLRSIDVLRTGIPTAVLMSAASYGGVAAATISMKGGANDWFQESMLSEEDSMSPMMHRSTSIVTDPAWSSLSCNIYHEHEPLDTRGSDFSATTLFSGPSW